MRGCVCVCVCLAFFAGPCSRSSLGISFETIDTSDTLYHGGGAEHRILVFSSVFVRAGFRGGNRHRRNKKKWKRFSTLTTEAVQCPSLSFQRVHNIHGGDRFTTGVFGIGHGITDHIFEKDLGCTIHV